MAPGAVVIKPRLFVVFIMGKTDKRPGVGVFLHGFSVDGEALISNGVDGHHHHQEKRARQDDALYSFWKVKEPILKGLISFRRCCGRLPAKVLIYQLIHYLRISFDRFIIPIPAVPEFRK